MSATDDPSLAEHTIEAVPSSRWYRRATRPLVPYALRLDLTAWIAPGRVSALVHR